MRLKHKIQHYLTITDSELKFLIGLSGIFLIGVGVKYIQHDRIPDYSQRYAVIDSLMTAAENRYTGLSGSTGLDSLRASETDSNYLIQGGSGSDTATVASVAPETLTGSTLKVNLNTASQSDLQQLPGIGPAIANRIVEYRARYGSFQRTSDLMNVKGIGPRTYEKLRSRITL